MLCMSNVDMLQNFQISYAIHQRKNKMCLSEIFYCGTNIEFYFMAIVGNVMGLMEYKSLISCKILKLIRR